MDFLHNIGTFSSGMRKKQMPSMDKHHYKVRLIRHYMRERGIYGQTLA